METLADQRIADGLMTARRYDDIRAGIATQITRARAIEDHRLTVILCCKFLDNFPRAGISRIEKGAIKAFERIRSDARIMLRSKCPVCGSAMADINCPDDMIRPYCAKCGRTYTPMGYMDDDNYALRWHATTWDGCAEPKVPMCERGWSMIQPIIDADQSWKLNYLKQLREARETGKPLSEIIKADADRDQHRISLRRMK